MGRQDGAPKRSEERNIAENRGAWIDSPYAMSLIYRLRQKGFSTEKIIRVLTDEGFTSSQGKKRIAIHDLEKFLVDDAEKYLEGLTAEEREALEQKVKDVAVRMTTVRQGKRSTSSPTKFTQGIVDKIKGASLEGRTPEEERKISDILGVVEESIMQGSYNSSRYGAVMAVSPIKIQQLKQSADVGGQKVMIQTLNIFAEVGKEAPADDWRFSLLRRIEEKIQELAPLTKMPKGMNPEDILRVRFAVPVGNINSKTKKPPIPVGEEERFRKLK